MSIIVKPKKQPVNIDGKRVVKYVAIADRGSVVEWERMAEQISLCSGANKHQIKSMMSAMTEALSYYLSEGHAVRMDDFGTFMPCVTSRPVDRPEDIKANGIHVTFYPSGELRRKLKEISVCTDAEASIREE